MNQEIKEDWEKTWEESVVPFVKGCGSLQLVFPSLWPKISNSVFKKENFKFGFRTSCLFLCYSKYIFYHVYMMTIVEREGSILEE